MVCWPILQWPIKRLWSPLLDSGGSGIIETTQTVLPPVWSVTVAYFKKKGTNTLRVQAWTSTRTPMLYIILPVSLPYWDMDNCVLHAIQCKLAGFISELRRIPGNSYIIDNVKCHVNNACNWRRVIDTNRGCLQIKFEMCKCHFLLGSR